MICSTKTIATFFALVAAFSSTFSTLAFAPTTTTTTKSKNLNNKATTPTKLPPSQSVNFFNNRKKNPQTSLSMSDNPADEIMKDIKRKAKRELPDFLYVDVEESKRQLAKNWGWITTSGVLTLALGIGALLAPIFATGVAYDVTVLTLGLSGIISIINAFVRENGHKTKSALSGTLSVGLAYLLGQNPTAGLDIITLSMAFYLAFEGIFETLLAAKNKDIQGRGWHFTSGVGSVLASLWLTTNIPVSSLFAPGAALGVRLISNGSTKVAIGLEGKKLGNEKTNNN